MPARKYTPKAFKALESQIVELEKNNKSLGGQLKLANQLLDSNSITLGNYHDEDMCLRTIIATAILAPKGYESLVQVLGDALEQAAGGKGAERHGNGLPFSAQPMQTMGFLLHSSQGMRYQVLKKVQEANTQLDNARISQDSDKIQQAKAFAEKEMLGAINYLAGAIIFERAH